jgi:DNA-binding response OmpR family regulator
VRTAANGLDGLSAAHAFKLDLVILDIMLPGLDRLEVLSRLHGAERSAGEVLAFRHLRIDTSRRPIWLDGQPVELTTIEFDLLRVLAENRGRVRSREQVLEKVWGHDCYGEERVVDVHVSHIRQKLGGAMCARTLLTGQPLDPAWIEKTVDVVLSAMVSEAETRLATMG